MFTRPFVFIALALQCVALRAELILHPTGTPNEVRAVFSGQILPPDVVSARELGARLKSGKQTLAGNVVGFASGGGEFYASMELGRVLRGLGLSTVVARNDECMSACAFAFMGGERRKVEGRLGVHRPWFPVAQDFPDRQLKYRTLQKALRAYIDEMDFPDSFYEMVMAVPPESMHFLAPAELKRFYLEGISPSSEDLADAAAARSLGLNMYDYLQVKAKSVAEGRPVHLTNRGTSCMGTPSGRTSGEVACGNAVELSR